MAEIFHYPADLDALVEQTWPSDRAKDPLRDARRALLEVAYHASMLREEGRSTRVRVALLARADARVPVDDAEAPLVLELDRTRLFDVDELRRIAVAAPFETALVAVEPDAAGELRIWGLVFTGAQWLAPSWGGRETEGRLRLQTVVHVLGPAQIAVHAGELFIAGLEGGHLLTLRSDVFTSRWMPALFEGVRRALVQEHAERTSDRPPSDRPQLDDSLVQVISQQTLRRTLWLMREARHGGTLLFVEPEHVERLFSTVLRAKYRFEPGGPAYHRYTTLLRSVIEGIMRKHRAPSISARDFLHREGDDDVEAAIFELSRTVASLSAIDGAVVLSKRFELLAFGVEIVGVSAATDGPTRVRRALDAEGERGVEDDEQNVGTRHRAAYRFVQASPRDLAIVVSHDGSVRFVASHDGRVTYHEQHISD